MIQYTLYCTSFQNSYNLQAIKQIEKIANFFSGQKKGVWNVPKRIKKITLLRSPHIDKKARDQFEIKQYKKKILLIFSNSKSSTLFLFFLRNSIFPGVEISITLNNSTFINQRR